jgi:hypothetical protein
MKRRYSPLGEYRKRHRRILKEAYAIFIEVSDADPGADQEVDSSGAEWTS